MQRICLSLCLAVMGLVAAGCGFLNSPENFGELQINFDFSERGSALGKTGEVSSLQAVNRLVVVMFEYTPDPQRLSDREIVREEFRLGVDRQFRATIQVPLQAGVNCFLVSVQAFDGARLLYDANDFPCFDEKNKRVVANIQLQPTAFSILGAPNIPPTPNRTVTISGFTPDTSVTEIEIVADSVTVKFPRLKDGSFTNPVMLFGDKTLIRISAYRGSEFSGEVHREVSYLGRKSDILVALVWEQAVDLNLEILNPRQQLISAVAPGDSVDGSLALADANGYGPEVYEWRQNTVLQRGAFAVRVSRPRTNLLQPASGKIYIFLRERQNTVTRRPLPFSFGPQDLQLSIDTILIP